MLQTYDLQQEKQDLESHVQASHSMCDTFIITALLERAQELVRRTRQNLCSHHH